MKIAVISDIHSNPVALEAALADAKQHGCERTICLGDIVGYGYDPVSCIDICKENDVLCLLGNHDAGLVGKLNIGWFSPIAAYGITWQREKVDEAHRQFLEKLEYSHKETIGQREVGFAHGSFTSPHDFEYIQTSLDASREMWLMGSRKCDILFVGHTHYATIFGQESEELPREFFIYNAPDLTLNLANYSHVIVNVGSVGYPRNQHESIYVILDTDEMKVHYRTLPFDFDGYKKAMKDRDVRLPLWIVDLKNKKGE